MEKRNIKIIGIGVGIFLVFILGVIFYVRQGGTATVTKIVGGLLPGGSENIPTNNGGGEGATTPDVTGDINNPTVVPLIRQITTFPVAGVTTFMRGNSEIIRYVARQDGNVYETRADSLATTRLSNMTIPRIQEALWWGEGKGLLLRYLDGETVKTFSATLATSTTIGEGRLVGTFLPDNITELAVNPKGDKIFYLQTKNTGAVGTLSNPDGSKGSTIFSSPLKDWLVSWPESNTLLLSTKPLENSPGAAYLFNITTRVLSPVATGEALTALTSPDTKTSFYTIGVGNTEKSFILSGVSPVESTITTIPEKCTWGKTLLFCGVPNDAPLPSTLLSWYRGEVHFLDNVWSLDTKGNIAILELDFNGLELDMINPLVTPQETHFLFVNKNDLTLWSVTIGQ